MLSSTFQCALGGNTGLLRSCSETMGFGAARLTNSTNPERAGEICDLVQLLAQLSYFWNRENSAFSYRGGCCQQALDLLTTRSVGDFETWKRIDLWNVEAQVEFNIRLAIT